MEGIWIPNAKEVIFDISNEPETSSLWIKSLYNISNIMFSGLLLDKEVSCVLKYKGFVKKKKKKKEIHKSMSQNSHNTKNLLLKKMLSSLT